MLRFTQILGVWTLALNKKNHIGRGFYLCPKDLCLKAAKKKHRIEPLENFSKG